MIETEIKAIRKHQAKHEKDDVKRFKDISNAIAELPTTVAMAKVVADSIQVNVNGKIDKVATHLIKQDEDMEGLKIQIEELSKKVRPIDNAKTWLRELGTIIMYVGGISLAVAAIIELLRMMNVLK